MITKYSMEVCDAETGEWTPVGLFSDIIPADVLHNLCIALFEMTEGASTVAVMDTNTGEVVTEVAESDYEPDWIDDDCGFDPYEGCFTYDC